MAQKSNPNQGIQEEQPFQLASQPLNEGPALQRNSFYSATDWLGRPIHKPDRNNPTRSTFERPLDTIRSFELSIDQSYHNRECDKRASLQSSASSQQLYYEKNQVRNSSQTEPSKRSSSRYSGYTDSSRSSGTPRYV